MIKLYARMCFFFFVMSDDQDQDDDDVDDDGGGRELCRFVALVVVMVSRLLDTVQAATDEMQIIKEGLVLSPWSLLCVGLHILETEIGVTNDLQPKKKKRKIESTMHAFAIVSRLP